MSKMTLEQEEVRNQEYNEYVEQMTPKHNLWANMGKAFLLGGGICLLGQIILQIAAGVFGLKAEDAALWCSLLLVLLSVILTSCNVYGILANWGGAGALVPITGFANGVCASAVEFQKEGQVLGMSILPRTVFVHSVVSPIGGGNGPIMRTVAIGTLFSWPNLSFG